MDERTLGTSILRCAIVFAKRITYKSNRQHETPVNLNSIASTFSCGLVSIDCELWELGSAGMSVDKACSEVQRVFHMEFLLKCLLDWNSSYQQHLATLDRLKFQLTQFCVMKNVTWFWWYLNFLFFPCLFLIGLYLYVLVVQTFMAGNIKLRIYAAIGWGKWCSGLVVVHYRLYFIFCVSKSFLQFSEHSPVPFYIRK